MGYFDWDRINPKENANFHRKKIVWGDRLGVAEVRLNPGDRLQTHRHQSEEIILVLKGAWRFILPGREVTVRTNEMLTIPPGVSHSSEAIEETLAVNICAPEQIKRSEKEKEEAVSHSDLDQFLWAV